MGTLPEPVSEIVVPQFFAPSSIGAPGECRLKLAMASSQKDREYGAMVSGPDAAIGTLIHRVIECAAREEQGTVEEIFDREYEKAISLLASNSITKHFSDLKATKSLMEWTAKRAWALDRAQSVRPIAKLKAHRSKFDRAPLGGSEKRLESAALRLKGSVDLVRVLEPGIVEVRDFKTGGVYDGEGNIKKEVILQLQAYGLMLLEQQSDLDVRLVVDDGQEREIVFDGDARIAARIALEEIVESMPAPGPTDARLLATPGPSCRGCSFRHVCAAYLDAAPGWWEKFPPGIEMIPLDTWGRIVGINGRTLVLNDESGRRVHVSNLDARHGSFSDCSRVWLFGLRSKGYSRGFDGAVFHPRSFHELPMERGGHRAWTLTLFSEQ